MKKFRFETKRSIGRWLAIFALPLAFAGPASDKDNAMIASHRPIAPLVLKWNFFMTPP